VTGELQVIISLSLSPKSAFNITYYSRVSVFMSKWVTATDSEFTTNCGTEMSLSSIIIIIIGSAAVAHFVLELSELWRPSLLSSFH